MATRQETIDFLLDQIAGAGNVRARKMFGEYALYLDEKVVALVCGDQLFVKITNPGKEFERLIKKEYNKFISTLYNISNQY